MLRNKAVNAHYDRERRALVVEFADGSASIWPVRLLEMVRYDGNDWVPLEATEAQLEAVELGGEHIYWDELGQDFRIPISKLASMAASLGWPSFNNRWR